MIKSTTKTTTRISAVFLAAVLVAGTFALISPSFMGGAQAEPYGMDSKYKKYSYGNDYDKKPKYPKYPPPPHKPDFSKDKDSVSIKKIKCNNINVNVNDLSVNIGSPDNTGTGGGAGSVEGASALSPQSLTNNGPNNGFKKFDKDFVFICINNNNNAGAGDGDGVEPTDCEDCFTTIPEGGPWPPGLLNDFIDDLATGDFDLNGVTVTTIAEVCAQLATGDVTITEFATFLNEILPGQANQVTIGRVIACLIETGDLEVATPIAGTP